MEWREYAARTAGREGQVEFVGTDWWDFCIGWPRGIFVAWVGGQVFTSEYDSIRPYLFELFVVSAYR